MAHLTDHYATACMTEQHYSLLCNAIQQLAIQCGPILCGMSQYHMVSPLCRSVAVTFWLQEYCIATVLCGFMLIHAILQYILF